jgi:DNA-binding transcriptional regulator GbsR (MarR family)
MDRVTAIFVDGMGAASATSGILTQLQGRIFALLYLQPKALALEDIAAELQQSKSNISINVRGLVEWHLVRRVPVGGSRKDHYEAATDFWRVFFEILERRYRFNVRQVLVAADEATRAGEAADKPATKGERDQADFMKTRLDGVRGFFSVLDASIAAFTQGQPLSSATLKNMSETSKSPRR